MKRLECANWDEASQTCLLEVWVDAPEPLFPQLTAAELNSLLTAILALWALAWVIRMLIRQANSI